MSRAPIAVAIAAAFAAIAACGARSSVWSASEAAGELGGAGGEGGGGAGAQGGAGGLGAAGGFGGGDGGAGCAAPEVCNALDDDCDGQVDEGDPGGGLACPAGLPGVCADGVTSCAGGVLACSPTAAPSPEICNDQDDDCDGLVDDDAVLCDCAQATFGGHAYYFCDIPESWATAQAICAGAGVHMLSIESPAEDDFAFDVANTLSHEKWWTGLNDVAVEGAFVWESGSAVVYDGWAPEEPNDSGGNEDCGQLNRFYPEKGWNDEPCDSAFSYICESP